MDILEKTLIGIVIITAIILLLLIVKITTSTCDEKFTCNPHYFGAKYSYPNTCPNSYINATGNYCNQILVCENER